ncbi:MAG: hypothetical protein U1E65_02475 [Myxococcota bacterium]
MTLSLSNNDLVTKLNSLIVDGNFSVADAQALTQGQAPDATQKQLIASKLNQALFANETERDQALATLGLTAADLPAQGTKGSALLGKVKGKLVELAKNEIYKPYDVKVTDFSIGDHFGLDLRVKAQLIDAKDPLVAEDKNRAATTKKHADQGENITWAIAGGGIYPHLGFGGSVPIGPASTSFGFSASASLGYSVLAPYTHDAKAALELAKNTTLDLPFTAQKAKNLEEGTEVTLRGTGSIAANASIGVGYELAKVGDLLTVGATFGASTGVSKNLDLSVRLKKLDGNKVYVSINTIDTNAFNVSVGAHAGVDLNLKSVMPNLGGGLFEKAGDLAADQVEKQVEKWINLDFRATHSTSGTEKEVTNYVIDLSTSTGQSAYEDLLKLDFRKVDQLVKDGDLSVRSAKLSERVRTTGEELKGQFGPITLLRAVSSATEDHGTLTTSKGNIDFDRATLVDSYSGIISNLWEGKRSISRELVATQKTGEAEPTYFYHVRHSIDGDGSTSKDDVRRFLELADMVGAINGDTKALASDNKFLKSFDDTDRVIDVYLTDAGLKKVASATPDAIMTAYAQAYERLDRPWETHYLWGNDKTWKTTPWLNTSSPKYAAVMQLLEAGPSQGNGPQEGSQDPNADAYRATTGRNLASDAAHYKASKALVKLVQETAQLPNAADRIHHMAEQDKKLGLDFWNALSAMALIAGSSEVMVNELKIVDKTNKKDLVFASEGAIQDPRTEINARLAAVE